MLNGTIVKTKKLFLAVLLATLGSYCCAASTPLSKAAQAQQQPQLRIQLDPARNRVWLLSGDGLFFYDVTRPEKVAVALPGWQWVDAPYSALPDLALGPKGEAVVSSNIVPTLWRVDPDSLAVSVRPLTLDADIDKDVGFSGLVFSSAHAAYFAVSYVHGSLWRIDASLTRAQKIRLSAPVPEAYGLTMQARTVQPTTTRPAQLCVRTAHGGWLVDLATDQRSAKVSAGPCPIHNGVNYQ